MGQQMNLPSYRSRAIFRAGLVRGAWWARGSRRHSWDLLFANARGCHTWIRLECFLPSSRSTATCVDNPSLLVNGGAQMTVEHLPSISTLHLITITTKIQYRWAYYHWIESCKRRGQHRRNRGGVRRHQIWKGRESDQHSWSPRGQGSWKRLRCVPGDRLALEQSDRIANRDSGSWNGRGQRRGFGDGNGGGAQPAAFHKTDYGA